MGNRLSLSKAAAAVAAGFLLLPLAAADAAPRRLDCTLSQVEAISGTNFDAAAENRPISVVVDEEPKAITVYQDGTGRTLAHVTITQIAMNGYTGDISLGIQTSSGSVVLQSYGPNSTKAEFGTCGPSAKPAP